MIILYTERYDILTIYYYNEDGKLYYINIYENGYMVEMNSVMLNMDDIRRCYRNEIIHDDNL